MLVSSMMQVLLLFGTSTEKQFEFLRKPLGNVGTSRALLALHRGTICNVLNISIDALWCRTCVFGICHDEGVLNVKPLVFPSSVIFVFS